MENKDLEHHVIAAARIASAHIRDNAFDAGFTWKKYNDPVTKLDTEAERLITDYFDEHAPGNFIGEEYGFKDNGMPHTYIIDPIDGTKSLVLHDFNSAVSIGVEENGILIGGVVADIMRDIAYVGFGGRSYVLHNGQKYPFRRSHGMTKVRLSIDGDVPGRENFDRDTYSIDEKKGSIALGMAQLAAGNMDGMITASVGKGNIWDVAAGYHLLSSNGFTVLDYEGRPFDYRNADRGIVALKPEIAQETLRVLKG